MLSKLANKSAQKSSIFSNKVSFEKSLLKRRNIFNIRGGWFVEFVSSPAAVGNEYVCDFGSVETRFGSIKLLRSVGSIKDRLGAYFHWNDRQGLERAINICLEQDINLPEVEQWSASEEYSEKQIGVTNWGQAWKLGSGLVFGDLMRIICKGAWKSDAGPWQSKRFTIFSKCLVKKNSYCLRNNCLDSPATGYTSNF